MLTLEIEFLTGVCFAAIPQGHPTSEPEWPPQPDRVFSALVAAWGARGEQPQERAALEWLEQLEPPTIEASEYESRRVGVSYVPPGDKAFAQRQPRFFPASRPHHPLLRMRWDADPLPDTLGTLQTLARDVAYVGHSASVVRCRFLQDALPEHPLRDEPPKRRVYPGRLAELQMWFQRGERPRMGEPVVNGPGREPSREIGSVFSDRWIVFEDDGGECPDLRGIAMVAKRMREALMSCYGAEGLAVPEVISGHQPDGTPSTRPHLAVVPLADAGWEHSGGRLMGLALVLPKEDEAERREAERQWLAGIEGGAASNAAWLRFEEFVNRVVTLKLGALGEWRIARVLEPGRASLRPGRYVRAAATWRTATPIVLDRFPKAKSAADREEEVRDLITDACRHIGLPAPLAVRAQKHSAVKACPSAYPSGKAPAWTGWTLQGALAGRLLTHAVIEFGEPVRGPVLLGAGRHVGLGLCLGDEG